jgi:hypothetical protein
MLKYYIDIQWKMQAKFVMIFSFLNPFDMGASAYSIPLCTVTQASEKA